MTDKASVWVQDLRRGGLAASWPRSSWRFLARRWDFAALLVALVGGLAAFWITLHARFLAYPDWLAVQKADFIIGPVAVGLYWRRWRPNNPLGLLLIALGLVGLPYILESSTVPVLFPIGLIAETVIYLMTSLVILSFPSGHLDGLAERLIIALVVLAVVPLTLIEALALPHVDPSFSISGCRGSCPPNGLAIWPPPSWLPQALDVQGGMLVVIPLATAGVLVWRFLTGTPPRRRALAIGGPIALLFLLVQATYRALSLFAANALAPTAHPVRSALQWTFAATRASIWYGFLFALIGAQLYAGRVLRRLVRDSLGRPSFRVLEGKLRTSLGDPGLRLGFWDDDASDWMNAEGAAFEPARSDQACTEVEQDGQTAIAIVHDKQLVEDPATSCRGRGLAPGDGERATRRCVEGLTSRSRRVPSETRQGQRPRTTEARARPPRRGAAKTLGGPDQAVISRRAGG